MLLWPVVVRDYHKGWTLLTPLIHLDTTGHRIYHWCGGQWVFIDTLRRFLHFNPKLPKACPNRKHLNFFVGYFRFSGYKEVFFLHLLRDALKRNIHAIYTFQPCNNVMLGSTFYSPVSYVNSNIHPLKKETEESAPKRFFVHPTSLTKTMRTHFSEEIDIVGGNIKLKTFQATNTFQTEFPYELILAYDNIGIAILQVEVSKL